MLLVNYTSKTNKLIEKRSDFCFFLKGVDEGEGELDKDDQGYPGSSAGKESACKAREVK